ncbi:MAG: flagellar biosynthesis repressor FlbT, partial [Pseudomonadota bacterium]
PEEANTPSKRLYYIAQLIVAGQTDPIEAIPQLLDGLERLKSALAGEAICQDVDDAIFHAKEERFYHVMRSLHRVFPHEAKLLATDLSSVENEDSAA